MEGRQRWRHISEARGRPGAVTNSPGGDGDDGDGQGGRFWAVWHGPRGEAPFSAPQAKKILGLRALSFGIWLGLSVTAKWQVIQS